MRERARAVVRGESLGGRTALDVEWAWNAARIGWTRRRDARAGASVARAVAGVRRRNRQRGRR
ncbi:hypothetical protein PT2222_220096 [Paraburkholderia tropica]